MHEMKAPEEFLRAGGERYRFLGGTINLEQVTFERVA
jgi:hypothetical protein